MLRAIWLGAVIGGILKLFSPHPNYASWIISSLVGGLGAMAGLFAARILGVPWENEGTTLAVAGGIAAITVVAYAWISDAAMRRLVRRVGRNVSRPPLAF